MMTGAFLLDERLAASTHEVARWSLSAVRLMDDITFHWLILIPLRERLSDFHDLSALDLPAMTDEIVRASRALQAVYKPDKINVAALGNVVPQLHVHVIARRRDDPAWPQPVWNHSPPRRYEPEQLEACVAALRTAFASC